MAKETKTSGPKQRGPTAGDIILIAGVAGGAFLIYRLIKGGGGGGACTPGTAKCDGFNLYTCNGEGQWVLTESNSPECGYTPEIWFGQNVEIGRKSFGVAVVDVGWRADNVEIGRGSFGVVIIDAGWRDDNVEIGREGFGVLIVSPQWVENNVEMSRQSFSVSI
jgi:hypothetical protein